MEVCKLNQTFIILGMEEGIEALLDQNMILLQILVILGKIIIFSRKN